MLTEDEKYMKKALKLAEKAFEAGEVPIGCIALNALRAKSTDTTSPSAQQNSSKSIGNMPMDSSSEGIVMSFTFVLMEMSEPVSM